jgi:osmotically inducible lipoprotein OsmB
MTRRRAVQSVVEWALEQSEHAPTTPNEEWTMRQLGRGLLLVTLIAIGGCAELSETQQRTLTGGTAGAAGGALIGAIAGNAGLGAAIGAGSGLLGGYLYGQHEASKRDAYLKGVSNGYNQARQQSG